MKGTKEVEILKGVAERKLNKHQKGLLPESFLNMEEFREQAFLFMVCVAINIMVNNLQEGKKKNKA